MIDAVRTTLTLANGQGINLLDPKPDDIDFDVIAEHLAKANRYCGATPSVVYSVAEHSLRCSRAAVKETGDLDLARYLLCHDMHEAFLGDDTTPKKRALGAIIESFGVLAGEIEKAFATLVDRLDAAIHARAGLAWPPEPMMRQAIKCWDTVLLATEWRDLMRCPPPFDFGVAPLLGRIRPFDDWEQASGFFKIEIDALLPRVGT